MQIHVNQGLHDNQIYNQLDRDSGSNYKRGINPSSIVPDCILYDVVTDFLNGSDQATVGLSQSCRALYNVFSDDAFWKQKLSLRFGGVERADHSSSSRTGITPVSLSKEIYRATHALERRFCSGRFSSRKTVNRIGSVTCMLIIEDQIIAGDMNGLLRLQMKGSHELDGDIVHTPELYSMHHPSCSPVSCLAQLPGGAVVAGHCDGSLFNLSTFTIHQMLPVECRVDSLAICNNKSVALSSVREGSLRIFDILSNAELVAKRFIRERSPTKISSFNAPNLLAFGQKSNSACILDIRSNSIAHTISLEDWCLCVEMSRTNDHIIRASDKAIKVFDTRFIQTTDRAMSKPIEALHQGSRLISHFVSDDRLRLASCGLDGQVKVSSIDSFRSDSQTSTLFSDQDYILAMDFSRTTLAYGGLSGKIHIYNF